MAGGRKNMGGRQRGNPHDADHELSRELERLDGRPYGFYKDLRGRTYPLEPFTVRFDHIQGDPFAAPSRIAVQLPAQRISLPARACAGSDARRAAADFLHRALLRGLAASRGQPDRRRAGADDAGAGRLGSGKSGLLEIATVGQQVLERTAVSILADGGVRVRLSVGLPAAGRRILGRAAAQLLTRRLPAVLDRLCDELDRPALDRHIDGAEDQMALRAQLSAAGLVAFLADDSILARRSGADDRPMPDAVPLEAPDGLARELTTPHAGRLRGLGVPAGVTLIVGGGYHGKSTLLAAVAGGVYDHIPGDGRDRCVSVATAVSIRAEDGRSVRGVDLRPFINALPLGRRTDRFHTDDASGSTSQAAATVEALEAGATALLIDEDTAATNFMIRDARMRRLVPEDKEPITPYLDRVRPLWTEQHVSSVLVVGGAGDYLDVADTVIHMDAYRPKDVTHSAREIADALPRKSPASPAVTDWPTSAARVPDPASLDPSRGRKAARVRSVKTRAIEFGTREIDVSLLFQLADAAQCRMIGDALLQCARGLCNGKRSVPEVLDAIDTEIERNGLEAVAEQGFGDRARARRFEIAAALNRIRGLRLVGEEG